MPAPLDPRKKPATVKVHVSTGAGVDITWNDGHTSHYDFAFLREKCPCAMCNDERNKKKDAESNRSAATGSGPGAMLGMGPSLPMFKPKPTARRATAMGNYAIQIEFSDGHSTGIYSFDLFRTLCPCDECARDFRGAAAGPL
jgi:DUF971 family protein